MHSESGDETTAIPQRTRTNEDQFLRKHLVNGLLVNGYIDVFGLI